MGSENITGDQLTIEFPVYVQDILSPNSLTYTGSPVNIQSVSTVTVALGTFSLNNTRMTALLCITETCGYEQGNWWT